MQMTVTAGVDIGSTATKALVLKDEKIMGFAVRPTGANPEKAATDALVPALESGELIANAARDDDASGQDLHGRRHEPLA